MSNFTERRYTLSMLLQAIRGKAATWIVKILFVLLIVSFGAWGITDYIRRSSRPTAVATIGSAEIRPAELNAAIERESERLRAYFGKLDRAQMRQLALADQALDQMVTRALIEQEAARLGIRIADDTVRQAIQSVQGFHNEAGQFDRGKFADLIGRLGYSEERFIAETRRDLTRDQLIGVIAGGVQTPAALVETLARYRYEKRIAAALSIGFDSIDAPPDPDGETLASFHDANASRFMTPELRKVSYLLLSAQNLLSGVSVSDDELKAAYESRLGDFTQPENREVDQLLFADETAAGLAAAKIAKGVSVHDAGGVHSDLGRIAAGDLPSLFADIVFSLPLNTVSAPVHSDFGWHLFIARAIQAGRQTSFEEARAPLRDALLRDKALDQAFELSNRIDEKLAGGASLEEIAAQNGLKVHSAGPLDQTGRLADGQGTDDFPASAQMLATVFGLGSGENTNMLEIQQPFEGFIALRLDAVTPAAPKSLAAAKDEILTAWREDQRAGLAQKRGEALAERLRKGEPIEAVAKSAGLAVRTTQPFTRDGRAGDIPAALIADLFSAPVKSVAQGRGTGVYVVAQLTQILPFDPLQEAAAQKALSKTLDEALAAEIFSQFTQTLKERFPVVINRDLLQKFY